MLVDSIVLWTRNDDLILFADLSLPLRSQASMNDKPEVILAAIAHQTQHILTGEHHFTPDSYA